MDSKWVTMGADGGRFGAGSLGRGVFLCLAKGSPGPGDQLDAAQVFGVYRKYRIFMDVVS